MQSNVRHLKVNNRLVDEAGDLQVDDTSLVSSTPIKKNKSIIQRHKTSYDDPPDIALIKTFLNPVMVVLTLQVCMFFGEEVWSGYYLVLMVLAFFLSSQIFSDVDLYRSWRRPQLWTDGRNIVFGWAIIATVFTFLGQATGFDRYYLNEVIVNWFIATPIVLLVSHAIARAVVNSTSKKLTRSMVIVGGGPLGSELAAKASQDPFMRLEVKGFFDDREVDRIGDLNQFPLLGGLEDVTEYVRKNGTNRIYIALPMVAQPRISKLLHDVRDTTVSVYFVPDIFIADLIQARFDYLNGMPVMAICETPFYGLNAVLKRVSDIVISTVVVLLIWPIMLFIYLGIKLTSKGPVVFKQRRYGLNGEEIIVYKFRTMTVCEDGDSTYKQVTKNDSRVTKFGSILRATSLDELPQIFNVLSGDMSLVGPRPHAVAVNEQYRKLISGYMIRHKVKPGITGWAQVNGYRGGDSLEEMQGRVKYDLQYLRNWSLGFDLWIIIKTALLVFRDPNAF